MRKEIALRVINGLAHGNKEMESLLEMVYLEGRTVIDQWPDTAVRKLESRSVRAVGCLIHQRINLLRLVVEGEKYWDGEEGKKINKALGGFIERRK